ncbi:unnamed protein product [Parascedosporium putredinis]|uniref:Very-long-chain 3-oxoacyl-CoA synthase n=1 Tax=Parascedosporium putredinis TaxID=1442378 RepID=A0A9P1H120_9PEZI|nr:unnamed protein product [Parascedosporium putredinis]CAI7993216.1 unnamed protein product [Parascedosporium putredinis]
MEIPTQLAFMAGQTIAFAFVWRALHNYVDKNGPIRGASTVTKINSIFYAFVSLALMIFLIYRPEGDATSRYAYHYSKFYEYVDILNVRASGGAIDLHFGFHHLTTCYLTWARTAHNYNGWKPFAISNTFHHAIMYAYFGGWELPRPILPWTGALQLIIGMIADALVIQEKWTDGSAGAEDESTSE